MRYYAVSNHGMEQWEGPATDPTDALNRYAMGEGWETFEEMLADADRDDFDVGMEERPMPDDPFPGTARFVVFRCSNGAQKTCDAATYCTNDLRRAAARIKTLYRETRRHGLCDSWTIYDRKHHRMRMTDDFECTSVDWSETGYPWFLTD